MMHQSQPWNISTKIIVVVLLITGSIWLLNAVQPLLTVLVLAALFAYLFNPLIRWLAQLPRFTRPRAAILVFTALVILLFGIPTAVGAVVADQFYRLEAEFLGAVIAIEKWFSQPINLLGYRLYPESLVKNLEQAVQSAVAEIPGESLDLISNVTTNLLWVLLFFFSLYYLLKDGHRFFPWLSRAVPPAYQADYRRLLGELDQVWSIFLRVQILMFFILGALMGAGFWLVIWLFRSGLIPFSPLLFIILIVLVVTLAQQVDNLWLRPQLMGKSLQMHPWLVFAGLTTALILGGFLWAFFIVPLIGTATVLGRYVYCQLFDLPPWPNAGEDNPAGGGEPIDPQPPASPPG